MTRYLIYVAPLALCIAVPIIVSSTAPEDSAAHRANIGGVRLVWFFSWVEIIWLSIWVSKIVAHYLPYLFQIFAGVVSSGVRKYSLVIRALEIPLSLVGWAVTSLATFVPIMTKNPDNATRCTRRQDPNDSIFVSEDYSCLKDWEAIVQKILAASLVASLVWLAQKFLIQLISINYHRKQFNSRIKESKHNIYLLGILYEASRNLFPAYCPEFAEEDYMIADALGIKSGKNSHKRSGSATPMRVLQNVGRFKNNVTSAFGNVASEITGKQVFNPDSAHSVVVEALEKKRTSEALARRIWLSFVIEGRDNLLQEDIQDVLGAEKKELADEAFWSLDRDGNGDISLDEMILAVTELSRERKAIASSMHDIDSAISALDSMLAVVVLIIIVLVFVGFLNQNFTTTLATTGTALLSLSFVFASTAAEILGSCIFLFVKHPFDVGDRVDVNNEQYVVEHISLLYTVFRDISGATTGRLCQVPNMVLNALWVNNVSRSKAMSEQLQIDVSFDTPFDDLQILKNELLSFVKDKENARDYLPNIELEILGTTDQSKMTLGIEVMHKSNWANESVRRTRRSKFICAMVSALKAVPIYPPGGGIDAAGSAAAPAYSVAISEAEAKEHADAAKQDREKARLVPSKTVEEANNELRQTASANSRPGAGLTRHQEGVVNDLTARDPASDPSRDDPWGAGRDDSSTLDGGGGRRSVDTREHDLDEVRGMLRRQSTRGKRKVSSDYRPSPSVPTIQEPGQYPAYGYSSGLQPQQSGYSTIPPPPQAYAQQQQRPGYIPPVRENPTRMASTHQRMASVGTTEGVEMSQVPAPQRSPSNPYRQRERGESVSRRPVGGQGGGLQPGADGEEDEFGNTRPYSGV